MTMTVRSKSIGCVMISNYLWFTAAAGLDPGPEVVQPLRHDSSWQATEPPIFDVWYRINTDLHNVNSKQSAR